MKIPPFVPKGHDPLSLPSATPYEDIWGMVIANMHEGGWEAKAEQPFRKEISRSIKALGAQVVKIMINGVPWRVRSAARAVKLRHMHHVAT